MKAIITSAIVFIAGFTSAQSVVSTAGSTNTANGLQLSYTVGEVGVGYSTSASSLLAGFNQPTVQKSNISVADISKMNFKAFPNPVIDVLRIVNEEKGSVSIIDINGKEIVSPMKIDANSQFEIDMSTFAKGIYFLRFSSGASMSTLKLVKT